MNWNDLYTKAQMPEMQDMVCFSDKPGQLLWKRLYDQVINQPRVIQKLSYSTCSGKPGWNMKLSKKGKTLATVYPESFGFTVLLVMNESMDSDIFSSTDLSDLMKEKYKNAEPFMKAGKWLMIPVDSEPLANEVICMIKIKMANNTTNIKLAERSL